MAKAKKAAGKTRATEWTPPVQTNADLPPGVKVLKRITLSVLSFKVVGTAHTLTIRDAMRESVLKGKQKEGMKNATVCAVIDCETGEEHNFVVPAVVKGNLEENYPGETYVGKSFYIKNNGKRAPAQRYNDFTILEVDATALKRAA